MRALSGITPLSGITLARCTMIGAFKSLVPEVESDACSGGRLGFHSLYLVTYQCHAVVPSFCSPSLVLQFCFLFIINCFHMAIFIFPFLVIGFSVNWVLFFQVCWLYILLVFCLVLFSFFVCLLLAVSIICDHKLCEV